MTPVAGPENPKVGRRFTSVSHVKFLTKPLSGLCRSDILVTRLKNTPPYRETGVAICRTVFPVVSQTFSATPPLLSLKMAYCSPKTDPARGGYRRKSWPLKPIALYGASQKMVTPIALLWDTKRSVMVLHEE